ncbi:MAG: putative DNA binding domain-containing protein [Chloroflexi bacterium]|nr:putative DNA binding domain-containing protein [Chloroflexota bacterium]
MDLHVHTPASADYRESGVSYLDILKKGEQKGLDIFAVTDHNTAAGYRRYLDEIEDLELLERRNRLTDEEKVQLQEFRRLREKILVLPGFELTCTLGFHVLGIFPPETTVRELEHLLLNLHVPAEKLDVGSGEVGATSDVLTAYRLINEAGGIAIAAHANSSHGVAMPGFDFGGQTRIAYTQDENLHALEVTDLTSKSRRRTQMFFSGTKPEYPRKMHCIQGSDAHRLNGIPGNNQELGVGDRPTEILLSETSFDAMMAVFLARDFSKTRPYIPAALSEFDPLYAAREEGDSLVQAFHESAGKHGIDRRILQDVVALANTNGGAIYVGASANIRQQIQGVSKPSETTNQLRNEIGKHIVPPLDVQIDTLKSAGKTILQMIVPRGSEVPYALDATQIFVRSENETSLAVRDEIVNLVRDAVAVEFAARVEKVPLETVAAVESAEQIVAAQEKAEAAPAVTLVSPPPHTGVEIVSSKTRKGDSGKDRLTQYTMRDLRNNRIIHNVTRSSARKLWQYAIGEYDKKTAQQADIHWLGDVGLLKASARAGKLRYDLVQRDSGGELHVYYGVTDDGIHGAWKDLIESVAGQAPVVEIEEENGSVSTPETFDALSESEIGEGEETAEASAQATTDELAAEQPDVEFSEMTLGIGEPLAPPTLITTPGRSLFPSPVYDLTPSTLETDDTAATHGLGVLEAAEALSESTDTQKTLAADARVKTADQPPEYIAAEISPAAVDSFSSAAMRAPETPVPRFGVLSVELPSAIEVATAPTAFANLEPTEIVSGETLAPILESAQPAAEMTMPPVNVNLDEQIVLPTDSLPADG